MIISICRVLYSNKILLNIYKRANDIILSYNYTKYLIVLY